ncbi:MAG: sulfite exporter TauE/SafE family protein [Hyphomicrobiales bacterium]|nr:MAG: sulfite exporter TauE/SafE family protein [Hyphomicrobiales bacterium]
MTDYAIVSIAAFVAGMLNTVAGGGTFLTFPALVYTGMPIVAANATSAVAVSPGYLGGALGFREEIAAFERRRLIKIALVTVVGGLIGSTLLIVSSEKAFSFVVPFLLAGATAVFAFGDRIRKWANAKSETDPNWSLGTFLVSVYGGYFNGGLGIVLLALFSFWGMRDLNQMNGLKNGLSFILSAISVAVFSAAGMVAWKEAILMMVMATAGGYAGAPVARALPANVMRFVVIVIGSAMSIIFLVRLFGQA